MKPARAIVAAVAVLLLFTACAPTAEPPRPLSDEQSAALHDYFRDFAEPCLERLGEYPIPDPITRDEFVTESTWGPAWSPFYTSGSRTTDGARGETVTALCPPEPAWLTEQRRPVD